MKNDSLQQSIRNNKIDKNNKINIYFFEQKNISKQFKENLIKNK